MEKECLRRTGRTGEMVANGEMAEGFFTEWETWGWCGWTERMWRGHEQCWKEAGEGFGWPSTGRSRGRAGLKWTALEAVSGEDETVITGIL